MRASTLAVLVLSSTAALGCGKEGHRRQQRSVVPFQPQQDLVGAIGKPLRVVDGDHPLREQVKAVTGQS